MSRSHEFTLFTPTFNCAPWPRQARGYVLKEGRSLQCSPLGRVLSAFLVHYFSKYVDYGFTRDMEEQLDDVSGAGGG
eukprot:363646-Chlamydomonas_euryale.AAC.7